MLGLIGLFLEIMGLVIVLFSQALFLYRSKKKWGSLPKAFLDLTALRLGYDDKKLQRLSPTEAREALRKLFPFAEFLYQDFRVTVLGLAVSIFGLLLQLVDALLFV